MAEGENEEESCCERPVIDGNSAVKIVLTLVFGGLIYSGKATFDQLWWLMIILLW